MAVAACTCTSSTCIVCVQSSHTAVGFLVAVRVLKHSTLLLFPPETLQLTGSATSSSLWFFKACFRADFGVNSTPSKLWNLELRSKSQQVSDNACKTRLLHFKLSSFFCSQFLFSSDEKPVPFLSDSNLFLPVNMPTQSFPVILSEKNASKLLSCNKSNFSKV